MWPETGEGRCASRWREMTASTMLLSVDLVAPMEVKSQSMACRTSGFIGRILSAAFRPTAQVRQVHQLRQALTRVPGAVPRGRMTDAKARLMAGTELGVAADRRPRVCS